jgi:hypothetical protein
MIAPAFFWTAAVLCRFSERRVKPLFGKQGEPFGGFSIWSSAKSGALERTQAPVRNNGDFGLHPIHMSHEKL